MEKEVNIYTSNVKHIGLGLLVLFVSFIILAAGIGIASEQTEVYQIMITWIIAGGFGLLCLAASFSMIKRTFDKSPAIIINETGFSNRLLGYMSGTYFIEWSQVERIQRDEVAQQEFVSIVLKDTDAYLNQLKSKAKLGAKANMKMGFSPVSFSSNIMKGYNTTELYFLFDDYFSEYQKQHSEPKPKYTDARRNYL